jgi:acyl carrier protein
MGDGKIAFNECRDRMTERLARNGQLSPRALERLRGVSEDTPISSIGLDSFARVEIVVAASEIFQIELRPSDCEECLTFGQVHQVLLSRLKASG